MPDFRRIDFVPMTGFPGFEQEIDACAMRARLSVVDMGLAIPAAFWVRLEVEVGDDLIWGHCLLKLQMGYIRDMDDELRKALLARIELSNKRGHAGSLARANKTKHVME